jgi:RNA polymerase sigma-32 factor
VSTAALMPIPNLTSGLGSFDAFVRYAHSYPMLTAEEERDLAVQVQQENRMDAAQRLILSHLRFVVRMARDHSGYGLPLEDLAQEGTVGLMKAVRRFDPTQGVRLVSFAVHWIRAEIYEYVIKNWRIVKVATTKAQRKLFFKLRQNKKFLGWFKQDQVEFVAKELGVRPEDVVEMEKRLSASDPTFDMGADDNDSESMAPQAPANYLGDLTTEPAQLLEHEQTEQSQIQQLRSAMDQLNERSQQIVQRRWFTEKKATLEELGREYGVSAERIRQIESAALKKMGKHIQLD